MSNSGAAAESSSAKSVADLVDIIIAEPKKFISFMGLLASIVGLIILAAWAIPKLLHLRASEVTFSSKGTEIELKSSGSDRDEYYLVVSPQASWQPTPVYVTKGSKIKIAANGRVNIDLHGLWNEVEVRDGLEERMKSRHPGLMQDAQHTPEEYFSESDWQKLAPRHYWSGPDGDGVIADTSFKGRERYKIAPGMGFGTLVGTIMSRDDVDSDGYPPPVATEDVFLIGSKWPDAKNSEGAPATGWLWLAINDVVEPQSAFPNAQSIRVPDVFLLDNLGFYRVVVTIPH